MSDEKSFSDQRETEAMFITTKTQTIPAVTQSRNLPASDAASAQPRDENTYDDGLVHNHDWANDRREEGPVGRRGRRAYAQQRRARRPPLQLTLPGRTTATTADAFTTAGTETCPSRTTHRMD